MQYLLSVALCLLLVFCVSSPAKGQTRPTFSTAAMDGSRIDTAALRGKTVVLNLWFINCPNCLEEIKELNKLVDDHKGNSNVVFIGLAASKKAELTKFLAKNPFKYTIVPDATMIILSQFGVPDKNGDINVPFPMHFVLDPEGKVVLKEQGIKGVEAVRKHLSAIRP